MKKRNLTSKLSLKKITITPLGDKNATNINGGISGVACPSVAAPCIPPTERCPVLSRRICPETDTCPTTVGCPTWAPQSCPEGCIG